MSMTEDELLSYIQSIHGNTPRRKPGQGITATEYAKKAGKGRDYGKVTLSELHRAGHLIRTWMTWKDDDGRHATGYVYEAPPDVLK
jgi:hypothetical protein